MPTDLEPRSHYGKSHAENPAWKAAVFFAILGGLLVSHLIAGYHFSRQARSATGLTTLHSGYHPLTPPGAPQVSPVTYKPMARHTAEEINDAVPIENVGPAAAPFRIVDGTPTWDRATYCLAQAAYYEARSEPMEGQRAIAQVVLNRVRSPAFPASICGVVYQGSERTTGCQFTFTCDGSLRREPGGRGWQRALRIAASALRGNVYAPVGHATHYHANYVVPYWASTMAKIGVIGAHDFYRWPGRWQAASYFSQVYGNSEPELRHVLAATATRTDLAGTPAVQSLGGPQDAAGPLLADRNRRTSLAIDDSKHTLVFGDDPPTLDSIRNHWTAPKADMQVNILAPKRLVRSDNP